MARGTYNTPTEHTRSSSYFRLRETFRAVEIQLLIPSVRMCWNCPPRILRGTTVKLTAEYKPRQRQDDNVGQHIHASIRVIELGLVEAGPFDSLVPVEGERLALQEQGDGEDALGYHNPAGEAIQRLPPGVVRRQDSKEEEDDRELDDTQ